MSIVLEASENTFISHLDTFAGRQDPPVTCRIAGGWVRDKLLGLPSNDVDVALTTTSGHAFAVAFVDYLKGCNVPTTSVGKVAANPAQSKHLETGTTRILGLECDFVGLRSEKYADTRIPTSVELGTPLEDASRRDLTINSLFYNVHNRQVEDHTGHGLADLADRIARTPLSPKQTFHDDPLRVLRCVRFASRFSLSIVPEVSEAIRDQEVQLALRTKVSKERVGIEVTKMMHHRPLHAIGLIDSLKLHSSMFTCDMELERTGSKQTAEILSCVLDTLPHADELLWLAACVTPFRGLVVQQGKKEIPATALVLGQSLKLSTEVKNGVTNLFQAAELLQPELRDRSALGVVLQHPSVRPWHRSIVWAAVMAILPHWTRSGWNAECQAALQQFVDLQQYIRESGLADDIDRPPLLNGHELQQILDIRPSPLMNVIRQAVNAWQLDHPGATKEDCEAWLRQLWEGEGRTEWEAQCPKVEKAKPEKRKR